MKQAHAELMILISDAAPDNETCACRINDFNFWSGIAPAQTAQLLYDLSDGVNLLLVIGC